MLMTEEAWICHQKAWANPCEAAGDRQDAGRAAGRHCAPAGRQQRPLQVPFCEPGLQGAGERLALSSTDIFRLVGGQCLLQGGAVCRDVPRDRGPAPARHQQQCWGVHNLPSCKLRGSCICLFPSCSIWVQIQWLINPCLTT